MSVDYRIYVVIKDIQDYDFKKTWGFSICINDIIYANGSHSMILLKYSTKENVNIRHNFLYELDERKDSLLRLDFNVDEDKQLYNRIQPHLLKKRFQTSIQFGKIYRVDDGYYSQIPWAKNKFGW